MARISTASALATAGVLLACEVPAFVSFEQPEVALFGVNAELGVAPEPSRPTARGPGSWRRAAP